MRGTVFAILAVVLRLPAAAQLVSVHEPGIRVMIPTGPATVTIPVDNPLRRAAKGTLAVSWLDVSGKESPPLERQVELQRGRSEHTFALPLENPSVWTRLRYSLAPDRAAARDFPPRSGIVALAHVSPDAFESRSVTRATPWAARPFSSTRWRRIRSLACRFPESSGRGLSRSMTIKCGRHRFGISVTDSWRSASILPPRPPRDHRAAI